MINTIYLSLTLFSLSRVGRRHNFLFVGILLYAYLKHSWFESRMTGNKNGILQDESFIPIPSVSENRI